LSSVATEFSTYADTFPANRALCRSPGQKASVCALRSFSPIQMKCRDFAMCFEPELLYFAIYCWRLCAPAGEEVQLLDTVAPNWLPREPPPKA
jgi:hypothetical protein